MEIQNLACRQAGRAAVIFLDQGGVYLVKRRVSGLWFSDYSQEESFAVTVTGFHSLGKRPRRAPEGRRWNHVD
jgi:hypothetical protein